MAVRINKNKYLDTIYYVNEKPVEVRNGKITADFKLTSEEERGLTEYLSSENRINKRLK